MKKLYFKLIAGIVSTIIVYGIFFGCQVSFAQSHDQKQVIREDSIYRQALLKLNNEVIQSLELKVEGMQRYVEAGQKNLDSWLKMFAIIFSLLIGLSVFNGLRMQELAKSELVEIRRIRDDINREAINVEDRLNTVKDKVSEIEKSATGAASTKGKLDQLLIDFGSKTDLLQKETQKKIIDESLINIKEDLQKTGVETLKNLYVAKAFKAQNDKKWEDVIRLVNSYNDLDENTSQTLSLRSYAYYKLFDVTQNKELLNKALLDINAKIVLDNESKWCYQMRGTIYYYLDENDKALLDLNESIRLDQKYAEAYFNRSLVYTKLGRLPEAAADMAWAKQLDPELGK